MLQGGGQDDVSFGGAGGDRFVLEAGMSAIKDFEVGLDKIDIGELLPTYINGMDAEVSNAFASGYIRFVSNGNGGLYIQSDADGANGGANWQTVALVENVRLSQISLSDFTV